MASDNQQEEIGEVLDVKFCPICGSSMHKDEYLGIQWWFCDDEDCGYLEPV